MSGFTFMMHCGATEVPREMLYDLPDPERLGPQHYPVRHSTVLEAVERNLGDLVIEQQTHALSKEGMRWFGVLVLAPRNGSTDSRLVVGLRGSYDQTFAVGIASGLGVFVCDNLSFNGEVKLSRRNTRFAARDLDKLLPRAFGRLAGLRARLEDQVTAYKRLELTDERMHDVVIRAMDAGVVPSTKVPKVLDLWRGKGGRDEWAWGEEHESQFEAGSGWRAYNAFTSVLKGTNVFDLPKRTEMLHGLLDAECGADGVWGVTQ